MKNESSKQPTKNQSSKSTPVPYKTRAKVDKELIAANTKIEKLEKQNVAFKETVKATSAQVLSAEKNITKLTKKLTTTETKLAACNTRYKKQAILVKSLKKADEDNTKKISMLITECKIGDNTIIELQKEVKELKGVISVNSVTITTLQRTCTSYKYAISEFIAKSWFSRIMLSRESLGKLLG